MNLRTPISNYSCIKLYVVYGLLVRVTKEEHQIMEWNGTEWNMPIEWNRRFNANANANANAIEVIVAAADKDSDEDSV
jgi:hypothetical protein